MQTRPMAGVWAGVRSSLSIRHGARCRRSISAWQTRPVHMIRGSPQRLSTVELRSCFARRTNAFRLERREAFNKRSREAAEPGHLLDRCCTSAIDLWEKTVRLLKGGRTGSTITGDSGASVRPVVTDL